MANDDHVKLIKLGKHSWNEWRVANPNVVPDLSDADLSGLDLAELNLSGATLTRAKLWNCNLWQTKLNDAQAEHADLSQSVADVSTFDNINLKHATLRSVNWHRTGLNGADLSHTQAQRSVITYCGLRGADLTSARIGGSDLHDTTLEEANFSGTDAGFVNLSESRCHRTNFTNAFLNEANLRDAELIDCDLTGANLSAARLIRARLDGSTLNKARLWETQRDQWSIKGVICTQCYWDETGTNVVHYGPDEFERAFSEKPTIVLSYPEGLQAVDMMMLPVILSQLQETNPDRVMRLRTIEDRGGHTAVVMTVDDAETGTSKGFQTALRKMQEEADELKRELGQSEVLRQRFEATVLEYRDHIVPALLAQSAPNIQIGRVDTVGHVGDISHSSDFNAGTVKQEVPLTELNDLISLVRREQDDLAEQLTDEQLDEINSALEDIQTQLNEGEPSTSTLKTSVEVVRRISEAAAASGIVEAATHVLRLFGP